MLSITSRVAIAALATLPAFLGNAGITDAARIATGSIKTELAANPDQATTESGITGQVSIRPVQPHVTIGVPNLAPYQAKLDVLDAAGHPVSSFETKPDGNFRSCFRPGNTYYARRPPVPTPQAWDL
jgi:hypothetical protein